MAKAKGEDYDSRDTDYWTWSGYRSEYSCPHGVGHGLHEHGCDGCCSRADFPLNRRVPEGSDQRGNVHAEGSPPPTKA